MHAKHLILAAACALPCTALAQTATFVPVADTTLYEGSGEESNGLGEWLFAGRTAQPGTPRRRALLRFVLMWLVLTPTMLAITMTACATVPSPSTISTGQPSRRPRRRARADHHTHQSRTRAKSTKGAPKKRM